MILRSIPGAISVLFLTIAALLSLSSEPARAALKALAQYQLYGDGNSNGIGPATLRDVSGHGNDLQRSGEPKCIASSPPNRTGGAIEFDGKSEWYSLGRGIAGVGGQFVLEAWARASQVDDPGLHGVATLGDGGIGYSLAQQGSQWVAFIGGAGASPIGSVAAGIWTHLAIVVTASSAHTFLNGRPVGTCATSGARPMFTIGDMGHGQEAFHGLIHEVRVSAIQPPGFDKSTDFLIAPAVLREAAAATAAARTHLMDSLRQKQDGVHLVDRLDAHRTDQDWLIRPVTQPAELQVKIDPDGKSAHLMLANGLISRSFYVGDNLTCFSCRNEWSRTEFLRSIEPEARASIDGHWYNIGGLENPPARNYFDEDWLPELVNAPDAFVFIGLDTGRPQAWLPWKPRYGAPEAPWPPKGLRVSMHYRAPESAPALAGLTVTVNYEMYVGIPVVAKWVSFENQGPTAISIDNLNIEQLATVDEVGDRLFVESEYSFFRNVPTRWHVDPEFGMDSGPVFTERMSDLALKYWSTEELDKGFANEGNPEWNGEYRSRSLMTVGYPVGPAKVLHPGASWRSFRGWELFQDSRNPERKGLARRQIYRRLMPWTQENPIYMHILHSDSASIHHAVDQCAAVGFDMAILTFGSGFDMNNEDPAYIERIKKDFDYAHSKGIKIGGYILFCSSTSYGDGQFDARPPAFGRSLCLGSAYSDVYFKRLFNFIDKTGMDVIETDGPYHGFPCEATDHKYHHGLADSYRVNWERMCLFYRGCVERGVYIISPDWYFAAGSNKMPVGYKEAQWTLPRAEQLVIARQNIYDGTWWRTPSMSYAACPLTSVYGGGPNSTMEPLSQHLDQYNAIMAEYFGMGIQGVYRGTRLYDTDATRERVRYWTSFFHRYFSLVNGDVIHVSRPDGRDLDCMMHVDPTGRQRGLAFIWNPLDKAIRQKFELPLYYTGLSATTRIRVQDGKPVNYRLDRDYRVQVPVDIPAHGFTWLVIEP